MSWVLKDRRRFLQELGIGAASMPFLMGLPSLQVNARKLEVAPKRLVIVFTPNGTLPEEFWPNEFGPDIPLELKPMLSSLAPYRDRILMLKGVNNEIQGDGDNHMRGMSCLLTATELNPGNIQGGGASPAGWASGISIDQEIRQFFQSRAETQTRFGSLEFGVAVPNRSDPWTRMSYAGNNQPIAPIDDPNQMFEKIYGNAIGEQQLASVIDYVRDDLQRVARKLSHDDQQLVEQHVEFVHKLEQDIEASQNQEELAHPEPEIDPKIEITNDNTPAISRMQIDMLVNTLANDMTRVASLQFMRSVGQARMRWLDIDDGHHSLSHEPDQNEVAYDKLKRINAWFAGEIGYLTQRLAETPEPSGASGSLLDHTQIVWLNELSKGNSHALSDIPFLLIGGGAGFKTNRALDFKGVPHNRLWLSLAHGLGHHQLQVFGTEHFCSDGPLSLNV